MQVISKWNDEQKRDVMAMFVSPGWQLLKQEFALRRQNLTNALIASTDPDKDRLIKAGISALDELIRIEHNLFTAPEPEQPFVIPQVQRGDRY